MDFTAESPPERIQHQQRGNAKNMLDDSSGSDDERSVSKLEEDITWLEEELGKAKAKCAAEKKEGEKNKRNCETYMEDNQMLQRIHKTLRDKIAEKDCRIASLEEERQRTLQESAEKEVFVLDTSQKVGKFSRDKVFHHKKYVHDKDDLDDITSDGSLGKKTMDAFQIVDSRRVSWWDTYKNSASHAIANQRSAVSSNIKKELKGTCNPV
jgi:predicted RNase H-like nuclease (RuvC/YqgF family)